jgi:hypothetical protein
LLFVRVHAPSSSPHNGSALSCERR